LQCIVGEEHDIRIIQLEWIKQQKGNEKIDQKIVVFHPGDQLKNWGDSGLNPDP
ncbi:hypothetical protein M9458_021926, partial [Cirrhinus mrigala]